MARALARIIADLSAFRPIRGDWLPLEALCAELWNSKQARKAVGELLAVFERFPEDDGAGAFWTILHGLESLRGYEPALIASVQRKPSDFGVIMVGRLLNDRQTHVGDVHLLDLLEAIACDTTVPESIRRRADQFAARHRT
jgi:hypothetical protein